MPLQARPVPLQEYQPRIPVEEGLRRVIPHVGEESLEGPTRQIGGAIEQIAHGEAARYAMETTTNTQQQWLAHLKQMQDSAPAGAPGFTDQVVGDYQKYMRDTMKNAPTPLAQRMLQPHLAQFGLHLYTQASAFEAASRHEHGVLTAQQSNETAANTVLQDSSQYDAQLAQQTHFINGLALDPNDKEKLARHATASLSSAAVTSDINHNPYAAMVKLAAKEPQGYYRDLTVEQRQQLNNESSRVLHERLTDAERVRTLARQDLKDASDNSLKQGATLYQQGKLTPQWVMAREKVLEPGAYIKLLEWAGGGQEEGEDADTYIKLLQRAHAGENVMGTPDSPGDAVVAFQGGIVSLPHLEKLMAAGEKGLPDWIKRGTDYITTMSGYSELNPNIASAQLKGRMTEKWLDWVAAHPNATIKDAQPIYQGIVAHEMSSQVAGLPPLKFSVGPSLAPDLEATKKRTTQAFEAGNMSPAEFAQEIKRIETWEHTLRLANPDEKPKAQAEK